MKKRIDIVLVEQKHTHSRTSATQLLREGNVSIGGIIIKKPSMLIDTKAPIQILEYPKYVGRGGLKLERALNVFDITVKDLVVADIGASTGGFTDCLLQNGANKVYAIDVGRNQLADVLRNDTRVVCMEGVDVRKVVLLEKVDLVVVDVSFISLTYILSAIRILLKEHGCLIALIKPQFEVGKGNLDKRGIVVDELLQKKAVKDVVNMTENLGFVVCNVIDSPILGGDGNREYLMCAYCA